MGQTKIVMILFTASLSEDEWRHCWENARKKCNANRQPQIGQTCVWVCKAERVANAVVDNIRRVTGNVCMHPLQIQRHTPARHAIWEWAKKFVNSNLLPNRIESTPLYVYTQYPHIYINITLMRHKTTTHKYRHTHASSNALQRSSRSIWRPECSHQPKKCLNK